MKSLFSVLLLGLLSGCVSTENLGLPLPKTRPISSSVEVAGRYANLGTCNRSAAYSSPQKAWLDEILYFGRSAEHSAETVMLREDSGGICVVRLVDGKVAGEKSLKKYVDYSIRDSGLEVHIMPGHPFVEDSVFTRSKDRMILRLSIEGHLIIEYWQDVIGVAPIIFPVPYHTRERFWYEFKKTG